MADRSDTSLVQGLAHVGIAVDDLARVLGYLERLGFEVVRRQPVADQGAVSHIVRAGSVDLELLEAVRDDGAVARHLARRGPGLHHLCLLVKDVSAAVDAAEQAGLQLLDRHPQADPDGDRVFVHPRSSGGVLIGLVQPREGEDGGGG